MNTHLPRSHRVPGSAWQALLWATIACTMLAGCAGMARGTRNSVYSESHATQAPFRNEDRSEALVIIRYPAIISAEAEHPFYQAFANNAIGGELPINIQVKADITRVAQAVVAKTNYYAMTLYRELLEELPEHSVLLSPHMIDWNGEKGLYSRPLLASEQVPSVLTMDFGVYSYPDIRKIMDSEPLTFGDIVTPLLVVRSNRWLQPVTNGLLLSSDPLLQTAWRLSTEQAEQQFLGMLRYPTVPYQRNIDFISFLSKRNPPTENVPRREFSGSGNGSGTDLQAVETYPVEKVAMNPELVAQLSTEFATDPFAESFVKGVSNRTVNLISSIDNERAVFFARQAALQRFDPELASVVFYRSEDETVRSRLQLAEALIEAEKVFLSGQSQSVYQGTYFGDYGQKMRHMIEAEYEMLEERRRLSRIQNVTTALAVAMLAGSVYGTSVSGSVIASALQSISGVLVLGSIWAVTASMKTRSKSGTITERFMALMAPELDREIAVQLEWLESKEQITARGFAEFRDKTTGLYQSRVRSLESEAGRNCVFSYPQLGVEGRWYGKCEEGRASAHGYGLAQDESGNSVEYLGEARSGLASGVGGMIVRRAGQSAPTYYEGEFSKGLPSGVVKVEEPGVRPRVRQFNAGVETGKAVSSEWKRLQF